jgi:hypothetical protein
VSTNVRAEGLKPSRKIHEVEGLSFRPLDHPLS